MKLAGQSFKMPVDLKESVLAHCNDNGLKIYAWISQACREKLNRDIQSKGSKNENEKPETSEL